MAFVYRANKNLHPQVHETSQEIGPGKYKINNNDNKNSTQPSYAPFGSTSERMKLPKKKDQKDSLPGPGQYQTNGNNFSEKVVVSTDNEDVKIIEVPKPSSFFKSSAPRFQEKKENGVPGPASYDKHDNLSDMIKKNAEAKQIFQREQKNDLINTIMTINKSRIKPSIPTKNQTYGYTEKNGNLEPTLPPFQAITGQGNDKIGPGHYQISDKIIKNQKGSEWHKYMARDQNKKQHSQTGPGQYEIQNQFIPIYKLKESSAFASQSVRTFDQKKGLLTYNLLKQKQQRDMQTKGQQLMDPTTEIEDFVQNQNPPPWQYHNENAISSLKISQKEERFQFFGSSSDRFPSQQNGFYKIEVGPGQYEIGKYKSFAEGITKTQVRKPAFQSSNTRFDTNKMEGTPAPGQYESKLKTLENSLTNKIKKGYRGQFGSSSKRFENITKSIDIPGPGQYLNDQNQNKIDEVSESPQKKEQKPTYQFKSVLKRDIIQKRQASQPPVGAYTVDYYDLSKKIYKGQQDEEEINMRVLKPGFNSSAPRFKQKSEIYDNDTTVDTVKEKGSGSINNMSVSLQQKSQSYKKNIQNINGLGFGIQGNRFNYKINNKNPGPGQYYNKENSSNWNKKSHNILFVNY